MPDGSAMPRVVLTLHTALTRWDLSVFPTVVLAALVLLGAWYLRADWLMAMRGHRWSMARTAAFLSGLVAVEIAFQSPVAVLSGSYFQAHVVQHLLLMVVAPPLLALGAPSTLLLQSAKRTTKQRWLRVLKSGPVSVLTHPLSTWILYYGVMFAFFLTSLVNVAMQHMALMDLLNVGFLLGGTLFWWPMVGVDPIMHWRMSHGARMFNMLLGGGVEAFLGVAIVNDSNPIASMYSLGSTHSGGALLWVATEFITLGAFVPIYFQWMRSEDRIGRRADAIGLREATPGVSRIEGTRMGTTASGQPSTAWEAAWLARTGHLPVTIAPLFAAGDADPGGRGRPRLDDPLFLPGAGPGTGSAGEGPSGPSQGS